MKVLPDLVRFMDNVHSKVMSAHGMSGKLEVEAGDSNEAVKVSNP